MSLNWLLWLSKYQKSFVYLLRLNNTVINSQFSVFGAVVRIKEYENPPSFGGFFIYKKSIIFVNNSTL